MKKQALYWSILILPFLVMIMVNEFVRLNTNEKGYLDTDLILIADRFELLENEVEPILHKVQRLDPLGIGSRSLEECLMIQLEDEKGSLSHKIVNKYFEYFLKFNFLGNFIFNAE